MAAHKPVPLDTVKYIHELKKRGFGVNAMAMITGITASTCKNVLAGKAKEFTSKLSDREVSELLRRWRVNERQKGNDFFGRQSKLARGR